MRDITVLSNLIKDRVKRIYLRDARVIRIGVDTHKFVPGLDGRKIRDQHKINDRPCILTVTHLNNRVDLILRALAHVRKTIDDVFFLIVGTGDDSGLQRAIRGYGLRDCVNVAKKVPDETLPFYYAACDVFLFPQPHWSWSIATIEAMACAKPVVVPDSSGLSEIIQNGRNGIAINILDSKQLCSCIIDLLKDENLRDHIGREARKYVENNLDRSRFFETYYDLMKSLCS